MQQLWDSLKDVLRALYHGPGSSEVACEYQLVCNHGIHSVSLFLLPLFPGLDHLQYATGLVVQQALAIYISSKYVILCFHRPFPPPCHSFFQISVQISPSKPHSPFICYALLLSNMYVCILATFFSKVVYHL